MSGDDSEGGGCDAEDCGEDDNKKLEHLSDTIQNGLSQEGGCVFMFLTTLY
jgi:hypothetical protein